MFLSNLEKFHDSADELKILRAQESSTSIRANNSTSPTAAIRVNELKKNAPNFGMSTDSVLFSTKTNEVIRSGIQQLRSLYGFGGEKEVPQIVKAWRQAKLDWHKMLPQHNSIWERFGNPTNEGKFRMLVSKEIQTTDFLTRFHESGLSSLYGHEHGPMLEYSGCNIFKSVCFIHKRVSCELNHMCEWSVSENICRDAEVRSSEKCEVPKIFKGDRIENVQDISKCKLWVNQPSVLISIDSESQSMFYHWWASWSTIHKYWVKVLKSSRDVHFFINRINDPMFFQYFGLLSNNCWRRVASQIPEGACFCDAKLFNAMQNRESEMEASKQMVGFLELNDIKPPAEKAKIGIISRRRKRFILNEFQLADEAVKLGYEVELLPLETMTMYEQVRSLRSLDVLVGMHGSGLDNSVFLHPKSVLLQLLPYSVEFRASFESSASEAGVFYREWQLKDQTKTFFHWDLFEAANKEKLQGLGKEQLLKMGQRSADNRETIMFWINQVSQLLNPIISVDL
jgi:hypothetical protein